MRRFTKTRVIAALSVIGVLALAGGAFAYFTSTGTGTGNATVGSSSTYTVTVGAPTGGSLYPGSGAGHRLGRRPQQQLGQPAGVQRRRRDDGQHLR